jgi:bacterioferritin-associated ferredoxin
MKITDSQIIEKVRSGLDTIESLASDCGITMGCGGCYSLVEKILKEEKMNKTIECPLPFKGTWSHIGSGLTRQVWQRTDSKYVIKVPLNELGYYDNLSEHDRYRSYRERPFAPCRMLKGGYLLMLCVTHVGFSAESDWTWGIDGGQVGLTPTGKLVAYDYAQNL